MVSNDYFEQLGLSTSFCSLFEVVSWGNGLLLFFFLFSVASSPLSINGIPLLETIVPSIWGAFAGGGTAFFPFFLAIEPLTLENEIRTIDTVWNCNSELRIFKKKKHSKNKTGPGLYISLFVPSANKINLDWWSTHNLWLDNLQIRECIQLYLILSLSLKIEVDSDGGMRNPSICAKRKRSSVSS